MTDQTTTTTATGPRDHEEERRELVYKVGNLIRKNFDGDWDRAFRSYAGGNEKVSKDELVTLLSDAGIGSWLTRSAWARAIMEEVDTNFDSGISYDEFRHMLKRRREEFGLPELGEDEFQRLASGEEGGDT